MIAHVPLLQPCLPARLNGLQADAPASAVQRAEGGRPARIVARVLETVHESSGCQEIAHVPLTQPCLPARLGELQADAPASAVQCTEGVHPLELSFTCSRLSMSLQGAKRLLMCRWRSHAFLRV